MPILTQSFIGLSGGMNQSVPDFEIPDGQAAIMRDVLLDQPGMVRRRGPVSLFSANLNQTGFRISGMLTCLGLDGLPRVAAIGVNTTPAAGSRQYSLLPLDSAYANFTNNLDLQTVPAVSTIREYIVATSQAVALNGGAWIGMSGDFLPVSGQAQMLGLWRGSRLATYGTGTISATRGATGVVGVGTAWSGSTADVGMFLFANTSGSIWELVGTVSAITGVTTLTLEQPALITVTAGTAYKLFPVRQFLTRTAKGTITTVAGSAEVIGSGTIFSALTNVSTAPGWRLYRLSDMSYVGHIAAVHTDRWVTLDDASGAALSLSNERFVCIATNMGVPTPTADLQVTTLTAQGMKRVGWITASYSGRQWFANQGASVDIGQYPTRLWFSDYADPESVDVSPSGDWVDVLSTGRVNTPIVALAGLQNSLAVFKEGELFQLVGNDPSNFSVRKIADVGTISPQTVQPYKNGVVFAGKEGIWYFDGVNLRSLSDSLGSWYQKNMLQYNTKLFQLGWSMLIRDHFIVFLPYFGANSGAATLPCMRGGSIESPDQQAFGMTFCVNLKTSAITTLTNINMKGSAVLPGVSASTQNNALWAGNQYNAAEGSTKGLIFDGGQFFDSTGVTSLDAFALGWAGSTNATKGPNIYIETKKYSMGDAERKKLFKQLAMQYRLAGGTLTVDSVPGMNDVGTTNTTTFLASSTYIHKRLKFLKRDTMIQFRMYDTSQPPGVITDFVFGPHEVGFKWQRVGRV